MSSRIFAIVNEMEKARELWIGGCFACAFCPKQHFTLEICVLPRRVRSKKEGLEASRLVLGAMNAPISDEVTTHVLGLGALRATRRW